MAQHGDLKIEQIDEFRWRIPKSSRSDMRVDGLVYANKKMFASICQEKSLEQVANVACLPGIVGHSLAMPDIHWGYGFCIGGVAATDIEAGGVISPGGVGYDINCGVRLIRSTMPYEEVAPQMTLLIDHLFNTIPCGMGQRGRISFSRKELAAVMEKGSAYVLKKGFGWSSDIEATEARGCLPEARPDLVSDRAYERGADQCGTLGSGNHFLEVQLIEEIFDERAAACLGLTKGCICVMIHSGSRGLGYQVCEDALKHLAQTPKKYGISLPDRQLVSAPVQSEEGAHYLGAMRAAANFAWSNRQIMTHLAREAFEGVFGQSAESMGMSLVYDVAHNIAKIETHQVEGKSRKLCVHRKGATRALPPGHPDVPAQYQQVGQPVLVPGDMGRSSYVLVGSPGAMEQTFGSCCHGAGRVMSRKAALKAAKGRSIARELEDRGVIARARGKRGLAEEQPEAYKDVGDVVEVVHGARIAKLVARLRPIGVIKG